MIRFKERSTEEELMDDLQLDRGNIEAVLKDIHKANVLLGGDRITLRALNVLIENNPAREYRILDVGCGDGSMLYKVAQFCKKKRIKASLLGIDLNGNSIELAREKYRDIENMKFMKGDILEMDGKIYQCDVLLCTLTLHHFKEQDIMGFVKKFGALARIGVIINDLDRNRIAYILFQLFSFIFMKTRIAKKDGLISIKSGFTQKELVSYSEMLPAMNHKIRWRWVFRYEWTFWHPNLKMQ